MGIGLVAGVSRLRIGSKSGHVNTFHLRTRCLGGSPSYGYN
jgi:hypothetical protein